MLHYFVIFFFLLGFPGLQARIQPLPLLLAAGGGYVGYDQYGRYKDRQLKKLGIEVPPRIASEIQVRPNPVYCIICV